MSRDDVADSLPGVAIAISLVPPLCVVGIGLAETDFNVAWGATLLFLTNLLSILLAGGLVLALLGLSSAATEGLRSPVRLRAFVLITVGILLVALPLTATTADIFEQALIKSNTATWAEEWLEGTDYDISQIEVSNDQIDLYIYGSGTRPELNILVDQMNTEYEHIASLRLLVIPSEEERYEFLQN